MYPNLFKQLNLPKLCNDIPKTSDKLHNEGCEKKLKCIGSSGEEEENYPALSVKTFFDFMRTAYQVNSTFEDLACTLSQNSEIDWTALAKTWLDFEEEQAKSKADDAAKIGENLEILLPMKESSSLSVSPEVDSSPINKEQSVSSVESKEPEDLAASKVNAEDCAEKNARDPGVVAAVDGKKEPSLSKAMKRCLSDVLHEGLLDSILPYMLPKSFLSQPIIKKPASLEPRQVVSAINLDSRASAASIKDKSRQRKSSEVEVEIHVCDEAKNMKRDFRCPQKLLIQKMCYFAEVTAGQKLEEMDISVHCDIVIFDWLMRWVKMDISKKSDWPQLEVGNVVPIMVSASFLQMQPLLEDCLSFCHANMSEILKTTSVLTCLSDSLLTKLADLFSNSDVEAIKDKKDKIQSRLFCKLIVALANPKPDNRRGHYGSLATLFKCAKCEKKVVQTASNLVPCHMSNMRIDRKGNLHSKHTRDLTWNLNDYIIGLRSQLRSWRRVYWRLWADCHFLFCKQCGICFPVNQMDWCSYHPESPQYFVNEQQRITPFPLGRYPCCSQRAYRFQAITTRDGCKFREHVPNIASDSDENIINLFLTFREVISLETQELYFPEKITRLVARDPSLSPGKLACKETFWWEGIEIVPPRPKLGLLAKIWGGSGLRKPCQPSTVKAKKQQDCKRNHLTQSTDTTETVSAESCGEEGEEETESNTSLDEESDSEESHDWEPNEVAIHIPKKTKIKILKRCEGMGSWSSNLSIRYNQDNQRDFEEKAAEQMISLLTKRTILEYNLRPKSHSTKHSIWNSNNQPIGGTYVRIEADFFNQVAQANKCKSAVPSRQTRVKSSK